MTDPQVSEAIAVKALKAVVEAVLVVIESDPHQWSTRPCASCKALSAIAERPFGCVAMA